MLGPQKDIRGDGEWSSRDKGQCAGLPKMDSQWQNAGFDTKLDKEQTARREVGTTSLTNMIATTLSPMQVKSAVKTDAKILGHEFERIAC